MTEKISPFDFLNDINNNKKDLIKNSENRKEAEKAYNAFIINKGLSYFLDTLGHAVNMNKAHHLDNYIQYKYLLAVISKKKRYSKWHKPEKEDNILLVSKYFNYNLQKSKEALEILSEDDIQQIKQKMYKGGKK